MLDFSILFDDAREIITAEQGKVVLRRHAAGELVAPTGRIIASDPFVAPDADPFAVIVPTGKHPVVLSVAHFEDGDQRVAGAMLQLAPRRAHTWRLAILPDQDLAELEPDEIFGYGVDSGTACFMDADAAANLMERIEADENYYETILTALEETYVDTWSWTNIEMNPATGANLVAFSSGMGDGLYASYFGYDEQGELVSLVTDFSFFDEAEMHR